MRTCTIKSVFEGIWRLRGIDPDTASLTDGQKAKTAELVNEAMEEAWEDAWWPELMLVERRQWRATWSNATTYAADAEVYHVDADGNEKYWISLQAGNLNKDPDTETAWWSEVEDDEFIASIAYDQSWEAYLIGGVDTENCLYDRDPRVYEGTEPLRPVEILGDDIICRADEVPARPYLRFRPLPPQFSWTEWDNTETYAAGDLVYLAATGQSYKSLQAANLNKDPSTQTDYWEQAECPQFLKRYLKHAVAAELTQEDEGRHQEAAVARNILENLQERLIDQRIVRRATFRSGR